MRKIRLKEGRMNHFKRGSEGNCFCISQEYGLGSTRSGGRAGYEKSRSRIGGGCPRGQNDYFRDGGNRLPETREKLDKLCDGLLSNPVIEDFRYEIEQG